LRRLLALTLFLLWPALAAAALKDTVTVEALGMGGSRDQAIAAALAQAVIQGQGPQIPPDALAAMFLESMREERKTRMTVLVDNRIRATRLSTAVAFVQDYQIIEATRQKKGSEWQARVTAEVVSPQARLARRQEKIRLALLPFHFMQEEEAETADADGQMAMKQTLDDIAAFRGLVAKNMDQLARVVVQGMPADADEKFGAAAENPAQVDWPGLSAQVGADSFLTVQVEEFRMAAIEMKKGILTSRLDGRFTFNYRLMRNNDGQLEVIKTGVFKLDTHHPSLQPLATATAQKQINRQQANARVNAVYRQAAKLFADSLLAELVPPDVIAREGDAVLVQSGAWPLRVGERLAAHGPDFVEPDAGTGMLLRQDGMRIAILEVSSVSKERIVARVVKGNVFGVQPGCLLRRLGVGSVVSTSSPAPSAAR
jgi:hypothetical protein